MSFKTETEQESCVKEVVEEKAKGKEAYNDCNGTRAKEKKLARKKRAEEITCYARPVELAVEPTVEKIDLDAR